MPLQNRVTPLSELVADPARGLVYGNRGCLHDANGRIRRRYNGKRWIACRLEFKGWHRAAAPAARALHGALLPRRGDGVRSRPPPVRALQARGLQPARRALSAVRADAIDEQLHAERVDPRSRAQRHHAAAFDELPDGTFVLDGGEPWLVLGDEILRWTAAGYPQPPGAADAAGRCCSRRPRSSRSCAPAGSRSCRSCIRRVCISANRNRSS